MVTHAKGYIAREEDIQELTNAFRELAERIGLEFNIDEEKLKAIRWDRENAPSPQLSSQ